MTDTQPISTATATGKRRTEGEDISQQETKIDTTKKQKKADAASNGATKQKPEVDQQGNAITCVRLGCNRVVGVVM